MEASKKILAIEVQIKSDPFNPAHHIALAKAYLEEGDEERARKVIAVKRRLPSKDPSVHFEWGRLCEGIGMARQAIESYEQAIALRPNNSEYHFHIALLYQERGAWERALKHLQKTVSLSPQNPEAKEMLASLYEEMGLKGISDIVKGKQRGKEFTPQTIPFQLQEEDAFTFLNHFQGREYGYARFQAGSSGNLDPFYMNGLPGFHEISEHLKGEMTIGIYPLRSDKTLKFSLIRVRIPRRKLLANIKNEGFLVLSEDHVHHYAKRIFDTMKGYGIPVYLDNPGGRERRVWYFFEEFVPLELAERFLHASLDKVQTPNIDLSVDVLLGFKGAGIEQEDDPILLPIGINPATGQRCFFIDGEGAPYGDQLLLIRKIRSIDRQQMQAFLKAGRTRQPLIESSLSLLKRIESHCPVLAEIIWKARSGRKLQTDEKLVIFFSVGFLTDGEKILHEIFEPCPDYRPNKVKRMFLRLKGHPISCPKIRKLMPERTAYLPCNCSFEIPEGGYPSPVLHMR